ncbi:structural maintenance-chromosome 3 (chondroitin sulfate proteoglycan 6) [Cladophialophora psammophila CBS 110553]|uniref:Structural maintenance of chromosomes protein n=1 Tax=Cladophialophora psammophila CBS 110553 TaxID=1182543 RepID=W9WM34_9EURO|nr:structural maintenance-chromosome 3 (chondroitin sulfate proteoglycan 6) [Cladophialophora psammophila CBS 110553]EXJ69237.1 structural maintenance-chromosome 3 (chondroitin sulfate proteoglycan 6) [Cladophialophora psammophila CBS 110553]
MHIKQITIQGFKSYKNQTVVYPFSPKLNVIVGRNGSGKSNFFAAIRFVLADAYSTMGREERQALIHEGSGSAIMSAYVEIVFDNSDGRFPTGNDELILRRTIGLKKDEYSLDRRVATKQDVMQLLENAGFSRANPYYIVPQGRITRLTNMKDSERLNVLKSVAGTQQFVVKKEESQKIMNDTSNKLATIDQTFEQIEDRLRELEEEQAELRDYQEKDRQKRALEYTLFHREQEEINKALAELEGRRVDGIDDVDENRERYSQCEDELASISQQIQELNRQIYTARLEKRQYEEEKREKARARAQVELEGRNLVHGQAAAQRAKVNRDRELKQLRAQIKEIEEELREVIPQFEAERAKEQSVKTRLEEAFAMQQRLYSKQARGARFKSKKDRNDWLQTQIDETFQSLSRFKATRMQTAEGIAEDEKLISSLEREIETLQKSVGERDDSIDQSIKAANDRKDALMDERRTLWRREAQLDSEYVVAQDDVRKAERNQSHTMDGNTSRGLDAVRRIKEQYKLEGCYGPLAELIDVPQHHTAVEVVAGNSLFHYVVDSDDTASTIMSILNREHAGRITFMPLNRLKPQTANFPNAQDARPLMSLMKYDARYEKAVQQVFGKAIIAQNLSVAAQYARTHGLTAVTPEGDKSDKKGALTGGHHDIRSSRLKATKAVITAREKFERIKTESNDNKRKIEKIDQTITKAMSEVQKFEQQKSQSESAQILIRQEIRNKMETLQRKKDDLEAKKKQEVAIATNVKALTDQQNAYQAELSSDFKTTLSTAEERQLESLAASIQKLRREYNDLSTSRTEIETRKADLEARLTLSLKPQLAALESDDVDDEASSSSNLRAKKTELARLTKELDSVQRYLDDLEDKVETSATQIAKLESQADKIREQQEELAKALERHQRRLEKSVQKKAALLVSKQETVEKIRELGAVDEDLRLKYENVDSNAIVKKLHKVKEALKKYSSVNKHAFEHYRSSMRAREELTTRRRELEAGKSAIENLIQVLDQRKDEAIERTFKQVSKAFAEVFQRLVPAGRGRLIIQRKTDGRQPEDDGEESDAEPVAKQGVENYTGVGISVSFNSRHDEQQRIQQLSGGQKSLCSLALIFAIQATDPAPFYIFDEIDANLDAQYRAAVAEHLLWLANRGDDEPVNGDDRPLGGQFICTTFRPEMLRVADKCFGVRFANNVSSIKEETKENALEFIESQAQ